MGSNNSKLEQDLDETKKLVEQGKAEREAMQQKERELTGQLQNLALRERQEQAELNQAVQSINILKNYLTDKEWTLVQTNLLKIIAEKSENGNITVQKLAGSFLNDSKKLKDTITSDLQKVRSVSTANRDQTTLIDSGDISDGEGTNFGS